MNKKKLISNLSGLTSNIQEQINSKADSEHTHDDLVGAPLEHTHESADITDLQGKLDGKANVSHTHNKSQITDFPTSLPANGGNADTVDGKHASDFVLSTHDAVNKRDARGEGNKPPSWYQGKPRVTELVEINEVGYGVSNILGNLVTISAWHDTSAPVTQALYFSTNNVAYRSSASDSSWNSWYSPNDEVNNLKSSVSNGKNAIASAITGKGVSATGSEDFNSLANKIKTIPGIKKDGSCPSSYPVKGNKFVAAFFETKKAALWGSLKVNYIAFGVCHRDPGSSIGTMWKISASGPIYVIGPNLGKMIEPGSSDIFSLMEYESYSTVIINPTGSEVTLTHAQSSGAAFGSGEIYFSIFVK